MKFKPPNFREFYDRARKSVSSCNRRTKTFTKKMLKSMIGPMEKGFAAAKLQTPPTGVYDDIDLSVLPKYVCYKAALLREKQTLQTVIGILVAVFSVLFVSSRYEISRLQEQLRLKEYILAPGVVDFTPAAPQTISDTYITDAVNDFITNLGNVSPSTIDDQYQTLMRFMSDKLRIEFELDTGDWVEQVKTEDISQLFTINDRQIIASGGGWYKAIVIAKADFYSDRSYLGHENHAVEMTMRLMPPESGRRWYLQIETLKWNREATYNAKQKLSRRR